MDEQKRKCLYCGEPIYGRMDKKFCCDSCRNSYNYEKTHKQTNIVRNINAIFTHVYKTKTGSVYYIVYDQAYLPKEGSPDSFLLVKFDER